jgi:2-dehydropantoate 2-reductase
MFQGRIGVIGAGALGGFYGARLLRAGCDVHFLMRRDCDAVRRNGLKVYSFEGDFEVQPPVYTSARELGVCDLVIVGLKTTDNAALPELLEPTVGPQTAVLTLQNGLGNEDEIAHIVGNTANDSGAAHRVLGGVAFLCSNRIGPGIIRHSDHGWIRVAEYRGPARDRTRAITDMFLHAGIRCETCDSLLQIRWEKLVWNVPFNGLGVAAKHADVAAILADPVLKGSAAALMDEVIAAARADGISIARAVADHLMGASETMGPYRTSMQIDYEEGRPLEVEAILGEPCRHALRAGIAVPRMETLYGIVRRMDRLRTAPSPQPSPRGEG